jgi:protein TonB
MPRELFSSSVSGVSSAARRGRLLPVSILFHAVLIGTILVLQLFANTAVPDSPKRVIYEFTPVAPPPAPPPPVQHAAAAHASPHPGTAPIVIPDKLPTDEPLSQGADAIDAVGQGVEGGVPGGLPDGVVTGGAPVTAPPPPKPVRISTGIKVPVKIRDAQPVYPAIAQSARVQGIVILEAVIDERGHVSETRVLRSIPLLDDAATAAVKQWVYSPTVLNGQPIPVVMTVTVQFRLER